MQKFKFETTKVDSEWRKQLTAFMLDYRNGLPNPALIESGTAILNALEGKPLRITFESYEDYPEFAKTL